MVSYYPLQGGYFPRWLPTRSSWECRDSCSGTTAGSPALRPTLFSQAFFTFIILTVGKQIFFLLFGKIVLFTIWFSLRKVFFFSAWFFKMFLGKMFCFQSKFFFEEKCAFTILRLLSMGNLSYWSHVLRSFWKISISNALMSYECIFLFITLKHAV